MKGWVQEALQNWNMAERSAGVERVLYVGEGTQEKRVASAASAGPSRGRSIELAGPGDLEGGKDVRAMAESGGRER